MLCELPHQRQFSGCQGGPDQLGQYLEITFLGVTLQRSAQLGIYCFILLAKITAVPEICTRTHYRSFKPHNQEISVSIVNRNNRCQRNVYSCYREIFTSHLKIRGKTVVGNDKVIYTQVMTKSAVRRKYYQILSIIRHAICRHIASAISIYDAYFT